MVKEIQAAIPKLSREEIEEIREWIDDYLEDHLELTNEVKAKLDQSRHEIADRAQRSRYDGGHGQRPVTYRRTVGFKRVSK
jgi:hypothetical protein